VAPHMAMSPEMAAEYTVKPGACVPQFDTAEGTYVEGLKVKIKCPVTHAGLPGKVYYTLDGSEPDDGSQEYTGPIVMSEIGNQTIRAVAMGPHVLPSGVVDSPWYAIIPDPICLPDEYEPHTGEGAGAVAFDIFERNCRPCLPGGTSPRGSKGILSCKAKPGYYGKDGGPFTPCPVGSYKAEEGASKCIKCPPRTATRHEASVGCLCQPGFYGLFTGDDEGQCQECPKGSYSDDLGLEECKICDVGGTTYGSGSRYSSDCVALPGWTNLRDWKGGPFVKCKIGFWKTRPGPYSCNRCPYCSTTLEEGSVFETECVPASGCTTGRVTWGIQFNRCKFGTFKSDIGKGDCKPCPPIGSGLPGSDEPTCAPQANSVPLVQPDPREVGGAEDGGGEEEAMEEDSEAGKLKSNHASTQRLRLGIEPRDGSRQGNTHTNAHNLHRHTIATLALTKPVHGNVRKTGAAKAAIAAVKRKPVAMAKIQENILRIEEKMGELKAQLKSKRDSPKAVKSRGTLSQEHRSRILAGVRNKHGSQGSKEASGDWFSWF
jgi:hypothetical protein